MLVFVAIILTVAGLWLSQNVFFDAVARLPPHLQDGLTSRYAVDPYIWSSVTLRPLRRRYVFGHLLVVAGFVLWALVAWPHDRTLALGIAMVAAIGAAMLIYKGIRYGV